MFEVEIDNIENQLLASAWAKKTKMHGTWIVWTVTDYYSDTVTYDWEFTDEKDAIMCQLKFG
jgi:hypothetical protein